MCVCSFAEWASQPLQRQCSANNNSNFDTLNNSSCTDNSSTNTTPTSTYNVDVYLGGSCETVSTWREDIAIPLIKKHGLTYYNPTLREVNGVDEENDLNDCLTSNSTYLSNGETEITAEHCRVLEKRVLAWKRTMDKSKVLLFVITNDTRSLTTMIMAAYYIGLGRDVVVCIQQLPLEDCEIGNEKVCRFCYLCNFELQ